jgi:hypothetical protein
MSKTTDAPQDELTIQASAASDLMLTAIDFAAAMKHGGAREKRRRPHGLPMRH